METDETAALIQEITAGEDDGIDPLVHPLGLHMTQILLARPETIEAELLLAALKRRCGTSVERMGEEEMGGALMFAHPDHVTKFDEGAVPAQTIVWLSEKPGPLPAEEWEVDLLQTYDWDRDAAQAAAERHQAFLLVTDMMAAGLPPQERIRLFHNAVLSVLDVVGESALAIRWVRAQRLIDPDVYRKLDVNKPTDLMGFATNVRMFRVEGRAPGETVMDTMGLSAFGLPDLQCHFAGVNASEVAPFLYNVAFYLFQNGDVIEDGNTLPGIGDPNAQWPCQHEVSLIGPAREVLTIRPSAPYAAGNRR